MANVRESSVVTNLRDLMQLEEQRLHEEARLAEQERVRIVHEHTAREPSRPPLRSTPPLDDLRVVDYPGMREAALLRVRAEVEGASRAAEHERLLAHARALHRMEIEAQRRDARRMIASMIAGALVVALVVRFTDEARSDTQPGIEPARASFVTPIPSPSPSQEPVPASPGSPVASVPVTVESSPHAAKPAITTHPNRPKPRPDRTPRTNADPLADLDADDSDPLGDLD